MTPLALSLGDPAGVGPELIAAVWHQHRDALPPFYLWGGADILRAAAVARGLDVAVETVASAQDAAAIFARALPVIGNVDGDYTPGIPSASGAQIALQSLSQATDAAIGNDASGVVTAPVSKEALAQVGFRFPGQTEFLGDACNVATDDTVMMLAGPQLRAVPVTIHCALSEVPKRLSQDLIVSRCRVTAQALSRDFGIAAPRLAVCGLNPHAGENGAFGREEAEIIAPAIAALRNEGIDASGPHAADSLFAPRGRETFDAAICMYHDQALIPVKALDFDQGVNVTLGLPIVRTSPDHGTAFDIAGKRLADPGALRAAIVMAGDMAARRGNG